jgi:transcriptional regulator with XRE-family HTH domain
MRTKAVYAYIQSAQNAGGGSRFEKTVDKGSKNMVYNARHDIIPRSSVMPKTKIPINKKAEPFGARLARFRQAAGYSQRDLAQETGISQRMIACYEKQPQYPPMHVLSALAEAMGMHPQEIMGEKGRKSGPEPKKMRLRRRLERIEGLEEKEKRQVIQLLDTFIEKNRLKQQAMGSHI